MQKAPEKMLKFSIEIKLLIMAYIYFENLKDDSNSNFDLI